MLYHHSRSQPMLGGSKIFVTSIEERPPVRSRFLSQVGELDPKQRLLSMEWCDL
ncbi:hypothetical protein RHGRI_015534 [Rhododendron griersonianum]|uniref:Uncharacterized protein n=1 Tax=Rhododendron griersonianum TaxID=479676 RepID=A0AAV6KDM2_9ERIC|nr:hypothetical protein RHGRI_015534 [Rhododendron griersonianum]